MACFPGSRDDHCPEMGQRSSGNSDMSLPFACDETGFEISPKQRPFSILAIWNSVPGE